MLLVGFALVVVVCDCWFSLGLVCFGVCYLDWFSCGCLFGCEVVYFKCSVGCGCYLLVLCLFGFSVLCLLVGYLLRCMFECGVVCCLFSVLLYYFDNSVVLLSCF